jgi:hypothetical protein
MIRHYGHLHSPKRVLHNYSERARQPTKRRLIPSGGTDIFLPRTSRPAVRHIQPHTQCVPVSIAPRIKRPVSKADHSPPSGAEVQNE